MDWFRNMKIQSKLFLVFGVLIVMVIILAVISVAVAGQIEKSYIELQDGPQQRAMYAADAVSEMMIIRRYMLCMVLFAGDKTVEDTYYGLYLKSAKNFSRYTDLYYENLEADVFLTQNERMRLEEMINEINRLFEESYRIYAESVYKTALEGDTVKLNSMFPHGIFLGDEITMKLEELRLAVQESANNIKIETHRYSYNAQIGITCISAFIALLALAISIFISRIIKEPIVNINFAVNEISKGNVAYPIRSAYKDEIGMLSNQIGDMVDTISILNKSVSILDNLGDVVFVTDFNYNMIYYNRKAAEVFNLENEQGNNSLKCYKVINCSDTPCDFCPVCKSPAENEDAIQSFEWERKILINGKETWYVCRSSVIRWVDGTLVQVCVYEDDTSRKEKEEQQIRYEEERIRAVELENERIRTSQKNLQMVLNALPVPVRIVDLESGDVVYVNNSLTELLEYDFPEEVCGLNIKELLPEISRNGTSSDKVVDMAVSISHLTAFEVDYKTKHGKIIETLLIARHIEYMGRNSSIGIIKDLTAEKEQARILKDAAEREREANQSKSMFLANMSHEIRTPMNGIIGFSELALDDDIPLNTRDYLNKIKSSAEMLLQLINNILDISKIEAGKIEIEKIPFNISEVFKLCRTITMPKALEKGITLFCYAEPSVNRALIGDPAKLRQALLNLLSNAVKFTNTGMVKLVSAVMETTENSVTMHFEVKDNGIGMSPQQIKKIFNPFVQADNSITRKYGGTGLGLTITKNIVELMGGTLKVESTPGLGSKFSFDLTFETIDTSEEESRRMKSPGIFEKPHFEGEVLVCEDNELNQQVICEHLSRVGLKTVVAVNGSIGVDCVRRRAENHEKPFDLIFMDIHMPVMDGLEAAKKLSEMNNTTPVIALTANIMSNDMESYRAAGMRDCVPKPFSANELWECLLRYLKPVSMSNINEHEQNMDDEKQRWIMINSFVKNHHNMAKDINEAVKAGDIKLAHRRAHTLKSVAGAIEMTMLQKAAKVIEQSLAGGRAEFTDEQMNVLEYELNTALEELAPMINERRTPRSGMVDSKKALDLLAKLDELLQSDSFDCLMMVEELEKIPGTVALIEQLEKFDFKEARKLLAGIRRELGEGNE